MKTGKKTGGHITNRLVWLSSPLTGFVVVVDGLGTQELVKLLVALEIFCTALVSYSLLCCAKVGWRSFFTP
jgi:hypothetical protein